MEAGGRILKFWFFSVAVVLAAFVPFTADSSSADSSINVLDNVAQSSFPQQIQFKLGAQSSFQISAVRLVYRVGDDKINYVANATFVPDYKVIATSVIDLPHDYLPPGVTLHFQWQIEDMAGSEASTAWSDFKVTDPRFVWHERTLGNVVLHWYDGDDKFADAVLASAAKAFTTAQGDALAPWLGPVQVYLYSNEQDFRSALGLGAEQWTGGLTYPALHVSMLIAPPDQTEAVQRSVSHELTHAAIDGANTDPFGPLPTWLDEGLAMVAEGDRDSGFNDALAKGVQDHHLFSVQSLSGNFPSDANDAVLAYAESDSLVRYFIQTYGRDRLAILIAAFHAGNNPDEAFQATIGVNAIDFQRGWQASLDTKLVASPAGQTASRPGGAPAAISDILATVVRDFLKLLQSNKTSPG